MFKLNSNLESTLNREIKYIKISDDADVSKDNDD